MMARPQAKKPWTWLDTETTGLEPNGEYGSRVLQVAVRVTDEKLAPWTRGGRSVFSSMIRLSPQVLASASTKALEVNKFAREVTFQEARGQHVCERFDTMMPGDYISDEIDLVSMAQVEFERRCEVARAKYGDSSKVKKVDRIWVMNDHQGWLDAPTPEVVWPIVHSMLSGCHLVCQNLPFDKPHVQNELKLLNLTYPADFRGIEIMSYSNLVSQMLGLPVWGLGPVYDTLAAKFKLPALDAHEAMADVDRMMAVYKFVRATFFHGVKSLPEPVPEPEVLNVPVQEPVEA